ncbi:uncharacterized protein LOC116926170 isoform X2 [Daphnia magna]|uniref:uncharacterized protein LOC116926170 isoform X2 n=1 Tax=Daphnia magna TaxID=35525 RepID=UPI0014020FBE|nr:uncharacterized protein LOC116926170 isoform X2 [Daphnia magna]
MAESLLTLLMANLLQLSLFIFSFTSEDLSRHPTEERFTTENFDPSTQSSLIISNDSPIRFGCLSWNEKYHLPDGQCYEVMTQGPCKNNQLFYADTEFENDGICDCDSSLLLLYSAETEECYQQNTQGPCKDGEWFALPDGMTVPICQPLPDGCLANGLYVFWSADYEGSTETSDNQCWELGTQGPCSQGETLERYITNHIGCQPRILNRVPKPHSALDNLVINGDSQGKKADRRSAGRSVAIAGLRPCGPGSRRSQNGKCRVNLNQG